MSGLKFVVRPADWELAVLPTQTGLLMHKGLDIKVNEGHGDKAHILWLCVCVWCKKTECFSAEGNALDILWFEGRVLRIPVWKWRVRNCLSSLDIDLYCLSA